MNKESMVIYESAYKAINYLPDEKLQLEAYKGLMEYGFYGVIPESDNPFVNMIFVQAIPSMRSARDRYEKAVEDGKRGGRPTDVPTEKIMAMKQNGMTNKQIAEKTGVTEDAIKKRVQRNKGTKGTNLSVSVSDSVSDSVSEYVSEYDSYTDNDSSSVPVPVSSSGTDKGSFFNPYRKGEEDFSCIQEVDNDLPF